MNIKVHTLKCHRHKTEPTLACHVHTNESLTIWNMLLLFDSYPGPMSYLGGISSSILSVFFTDKFALSQSDARISVAFNSCQ